jgi:hypothetical protein
MFPIAIGSKMAHFGNVTRLIKKMFVMFVMFVVK